MCLSCLGLKGHQRDIQRDVGGGGQCIVTGLCSLKEIHVSHGIFMES